MLFGPLIDDSSTDLHQLGTKWAVVLPGRSKLHGSSLFCFPDSQTPFPALPAEMRERGSHGDAFGLAFPSNSPILVIGGHLSDSSSFHFLEGTFFFSAQMLMLAAQRAHKPPAV